MRDACSASVPYPLEPIYFHAAPRNRGASHVYERGWPHGVTVKDLVAA